MRFTTPLAFWGFLSGSTGLNVLLGNSVLSILGSGIVNCEAKTKDGTCWTGIGLEVGLTTGPTRAFWDATWIRGYFSSSVYYRDQDLLINGAIGFDVGLHEARQFSLGLFLSANLTGVGSWEPQSKVIPEGDLELVGGLRIWLGSVPLSALPINLL
ncbi:MAG: hypothetical protein H6716_26510 [Polyangiaceae bacterium]|nr:hypothetical protein [Polyangiaceae bacterium]MCB9647678.1 hypothetical protein [Deltaproteobacteria bacterium]